MYGTARVLIALRTIGQARAMAERLAATSNAAVQRGVDWLVQETDKGSELPASPIGMYFAKLWYYEQLYPLIFAVDALNAQACPSKADKKNDA